MCKTKNELKCANDDPGTCVARCEEDDAEFRKDYPRCTPQYEPVVECASELPVTGWECNGDGKSSSKDGVCKTELDALLKCLLDEPAN